MNLKEMVTQLCGEWKIPLHSEKKVFSLHINPTTSVQVHELSPGFSLFAPISECPGKKREDLFIHLMQANFLGQGTGGARIGLDGNEKHLTLSHGFPYEMNYQDFKESVEDFVNYVVYWRDETAKFEQER